MSHIAYRYGVRVLREHVVPDDAWDQLAKRAAYWNALVLLDRQYRQTMDALVAPHVPTDGTTEEQQQAARKAALRLPEVQAALKLAQQEVYSAQRQQRGASGLYWGTYQGVEQAWATARQENPRQMRLHRASREGTLSVHFQDGGLPVSQLWHGNNLLQIEPVSPEVYQAARATRRKETWTPFRFRVASTPDREPVWLTGTVCLHRPLPADGIVRWAHLRIEADPAHWDPTTQQPHRRYSLVIAVEQESTATSHEPHLWGVDVGWRRVEGGMRTALACDTEGNVRELVLPERLLGAYDWADRFRAGRDLQRNSIRQALVDYRGAPETHLPEFLREQLHNVGQWNSPGRFRWLYYHWERHAGDDAVYTRLHGWERQDRHLAACVSGAQQRAALWRENIYGAWLKDLMASASMVVVEDTNWRELSQQVDEHGEQGQQRRIASVGWLLERLRQVGAREGVEVVRLPAANTTRQCSWCGHTNDDGGSDLYLRCDGCGRRYDQDLNAARNLVRGLASGDGTQDGTRDRSQPQARWKRIRDASNKGVAE